MKHFPDWSMDTQTTLCHGDRVLILIVDDDPDNLILLGYQVSQLFDCLMLTAADGSTALTLAKTARPNLILLDIMLPDMDGFEVARRLKQDAETRHIPLIAVTAMARVQDQELALQSGYDDYIRKPYELDALGVTLQHHLKTNYACELSTPIPILGSYAHVEKDWSDRL